jgi:hypothetical protein
MANSNIRKRTKYQTLPEIAEQVQTTNKFESLNELPSDNNQNKQPPTPRNPVNPKREQKFTFTLVTLLLTILEQLHSLISI